MDQTINERWLQFAYLNSKGNIVKTPLKFPFHIDLQVDQEFVFIIMDKSYTFHCREVAYRSNDNDTIDAIYVVATNNQ